MRYKESKEILKHIKVSKNILLNCHRGPDPDSIGSTLALYYVLRAMDKKVEIVCFSEELFGNVDFLKDFNKIKTKVDFTNFDYSSYDLFITLDSSSWDMVSGDKEIPLPKLPIFVIDHHETNTHYGEINLVDDTVSSTGELLFRLFGDWEIEINSDTATALLTAIIGDTGGFKYKNTTANTLDIAKLLMDKGADKDKIIFNIYQRGDFSLLKILGEILNRMEFDKVGKFVWSTLPYEKYIELGGHPYARETAADYFSSSVDGTDFGYIGIEREKNVLTLSFRSRTGFDVSKIALELGGGGHTAAGGARVKDLPFDDAVEKVLTVARKYAKEYKKAL